MDPNSHRNQFRGDHLDLFVHRTLQRSGDFDCRQLQCCRASSLFMLGNELLYWFLSDGDCSPSLCHIKSILNQRQFVHGVRFAEISLRYAKGQLRWGGALFGSPVRTGGRLARHSKLPTFVLLPQAEFDLCRGPETKSPFPHIVRIYYGQIASRIEFRV